MKRRTLLKGIGTTGLLAAGSLRGAAKADRAGDGGPGLLRFADDREPVVVEDGAIE